MRRVRFDLLSVVVALPDTGTLSEGAVDPKTIASDISLNASDTSPANVGANVNVTTWLCPAARTKDSGDADNETLPEIGRTLVMEA